MKPLWSNIIVGVLVIACAVAGFRLYKKVVREEAIQKKIKIQERAIKEKLLFYATIQKISLKSQKKYLGNWDEFRSFIDTSKIVVTERKEEIKELYFGKDTSIVTIDTVLVTTVKDSILKHTSYELRTLEYVPEVEGIFIPSEDKSPTFLIYAGYSKGRNVFEIRDSDPINPRRTSGELDTLMVGSKFEATTEGNWR